MCDSHRPLNGADSACPTCDGKGTVMGGDAPRSCPRCHGKEECGSCGRMVPAEQTQRLTDGRTHWVRCLECKRKADERYAESVA